MTKKAKIGIFGGGPSGLLVAYFLSKKNYEVHVFESSNQLGGLAQSLQLWGKKVEIGPHFLNPIGSLPVEELIYSLFTRDQLLFFDRNTSMFLHQNKSISYPPSLGSLIRNLNILDLLKAAFSFVFAQFKSKTPNNSKEYFENKVGKFLTKYLMNDYSLKLWGIELEHLDVIYGQSMIPFNINKSFISKIFRSKGNSKFSKHVYFENGISDLWEKIYEACGSYVFFNTGSTINSCIYENNKFIVSIDANKENTFDSIISTLPSNVNKKLLNLPVYDSFEFRNLILVYLKTQKQNVLDDHFVFIASKKAQVVRITDFSHFPSQNIGPNVVLMEYWTGNSGLWNESEVGIKEIVEFDLTQLKLAFEIEDYFIKKIPNAYRIPKVGIVNEMKTESSFQQDLPFFSIGRSNSAQFNYSIGTAVDEAYLFCNKW